MRAFRPLLLSLLLLIPALAGAANKYALVKAKDNLTLRATASATGAHVETLLRYQPVEVLDRKTVDNKGWAHIRTVKADASKSSTGWVLADYLTQTAFAMAGDDKLNVRRGPGTNYDVIMHYGKNYPVQIMDVATNGWVKLRDVDGDMGWVHPGLLSLDPPWVITAGPYKIFNVREGVGAETPLKFRAEKGYPLQVIEEKAGWLHVKDKDNAEGWISAKIVFGWLDPDFPKTSGDMVDAPKPQAKADADASSKSDSAAGSAKKDSGTSGTQKQKASTTGASSSSNKKPASASASAAKSGKGDKGTAKPESDDKTSLKPDSGAASGGSAAKDSSKN